jgi:hypothetical protein
MKPLSDIRTTELKDIDPTFTYQDKQADSRLANTTIMDWDVAKFKGIDKVKNIEKAALQLVQSWAKEGQTVTPVTKRKIKEIMALDDFASMAALIMPKLIEHGIPFLEKLWNTKVKPKLKSYFGGDEGMLPQDNPANPLQSQMMRYEPGFNKEVPGVIAPKISDRYDLVSPHHVKAVICPEMFAHRQSTKFPQKVALASAVLETTITVNATGSAGVYIDGVAGCSIACIFTMNDSTYTPTTGTQTAAATSTSGMFYSLVSAIGQFRIVGFSVQVIPIISNNSAGAISMGYWPNTMGDVTIINPAVTVNTGVVTTNPAVPVSALVTSPYYTYGNARTSYRMISIPSDFTADTFVNSATTVNTSPVNGTDIFYIGFTGFTASTSAAKIILSAVYDFKPTSAYSAICPQSYPQAGPMTNEVIATTTAAFPVLQALTLNDAKQIATSLPEESCSYSHIYNHVRQAVSNIKPTTAGLIYIDSNANNNNNVNLQESKPILDFESEFSRPEESKEMEFMAN